MPWVWIPDGVDTKRMNRYVTALGTLLKLEPWPDELAIVQLCEELDDDPDMFSAVWAHLDRWMRRDIKRIRDDRREKTGASIDLPRHDGRALRRTED